MQPHSLWRTLIIDDDPACRTQLRVLLKGHAEIQVVGEAESLAEAMEQCSARNPDLLFLNVQMQGSSGFELLPLLRRLPGIIFTATQEEGAVQAIEVGAVDYLIKPVTPERLGVATARLRGRLPDVASKLRPLYMADIMVVPVHRSYRVVATRQIVSLRADAGYSILNLVDGREIYVYRSLNDWEGHLPPGAFLRLDRSLIVAPAHIQDLEILKRETADLNLTGMAVPLQIGRTAISRLRDYFGAADLTSLPKRITI